jgi:hypothetical protein
MLGVRDSQSTLLPAILNMIARTRSAIHRDIRCASVVMARLRFAKVSRVYSRKDRRRTGLVVIMAWCLGFHVKPFGLQKISGIYRPYANHHRSPSESQPTTTGEDPSGCSCTVPVRFDLSPLLPTFCCSSVSFLVVQPDSAMDGLTGI